MTTPKLPIWHPYTLEGINKIGTGSYGSVILAKITNANQKLAVKRNLIPKQTSFLGSIRELDILTRLRDHPCIVRLESISLGNPIKPNINIQHNDDKRLRVDSLHFIFENGAYDGHTLIHGGKTSYSYLKMAMCQLLLGVEYMHSRGIIHRDLKPNNLLWIRQGVNRVLKICDFGMSKFFSITPSNNLRVMTAWYRAPEIIFGNNKYDAKVDIWSVGCIMFEMISRKALLYNIDKRDNTVVLINKLMEIIPEVPSQELINSLDSGNNSIKLNYYMYSKRRPTYDSLINLSTNNILSFNADRYGKYNDYLDLLHKCLKFDPKKRYTATKALDHKFFDGFRQYINQVRNRFPLTTTPSDLIDPKQIKYETVNTIERVWAMSILKSIINKRKDFHNYKDRMIFMSLDMFDRYLVYLHKNGIYHKNIAPNGIMLEDGSYRGPYHTKFESELRAVACFYISLKYYTTMRQVHSYHKFVGNDFKTNQAIKDVEKFELSMITIVMNYQIYRPTLYESIDLFRLHLNSDQIYELFDYYFSSEFVISTDIRSNVNTPTLYDLLDKYLRNHSVLSNELVKVIMPKKSTNIIIQKSLKINPKISVSPSYAPVFPADKMNYISMNSTRVPLGNVGMNTVAGMPTNFNPIYQTIRPLNHGIQPSILVQPINNGP